MSNGGTNEFMHSDALGNVTALSEVTLPTVSRTTTYDPFGKIIRDSASVTYSAEYVGACGVRDINPPAGSRYVMGVRMYDPSNGRFTSEDPLGYKADMNVFRYAMNNPIRFIDPTGLKVQVCCRPVNYPGLGSFKHCFITTDYGTYSLIQQNGIGVKMYNYSADVASGAPCSVAGGQDCGDKDRCIANAFNKMPSISFYGGAFDNSNTFVSDLLKSCGLSFNFPPGAIGH